MNALRVIAPELPFQIKYMEITEAEQTFEMNGYRLRAFRVNHNVTCYGYTMEIDRAGKFDVERAKASNIPQEYWGILQKGETVETKRHVYTPDMVLGPARKGIKLTYTTDTSLRNLLSRMQSIPISLSVKECMAKRISRRKPKNISI